MRKIFSNSYPGVQTVLDDILVPIFGEHTTHNEDVLGTFPEKRNIAQSANITQIKRVANFILDDKPLDIFDITLSSNARLQYSRVNIQRVVRSLMDVYTGALMFFHYEDNQGDWRISFVEKDDTQKSTTSAKRYTYLVGEHHAVRTVTDRFKVLAETPSKTVEALREAFSVEALSDEFFEKYKEIYADFVEYISGKRYVKKGSKWEEKFVGKPDENTLLEDVFGNDEKAVRDYVKKTMGRLVFLQFLQKKGWLDVPADQEWGNGNKNYLQDLFNNSNYKNNFLEKVLEPLFFNTLNTKRDNDIATNIPGTYGKIPYLNGGLFENDFDDNGVVVFPEKYFRSLINFFGEYNFTIDENDPNDMEIGIDPEMLGKIFENLLEDNKDKGAYYTPKEIVQYMCKESLIAYLSESKENDEIRQFVSTHNTEDFTSDEKEHLLQRLKDVKVCDPAIGSGAFPMGMLNELFACRTALEDNGESSAQIKREIIQNNIYGVDIEKGAIDIARLRFWLAIVVDNDTPEPLPNFDYKIVEGNSLLTTFDGKYLNISSQQQHLNAQAIRVKKEILQKKQKEFFTLFGKEKYEREREIKNLILDVIELQLGYERTSWVVKQYRTGNLFQDSEPRQMSFAEIAQKMAPEKESAIKLCAYIRKSLNDNSKPIEEQARTQIPFFDWHIIFADVFDPTSKQGGGFDIVIGNPPYIKEYTNRKAFEGFRETSPYYMGKMDIWYGFACQGIDLLTKSGVLCFIAQNNWTTSAGAKKMRNKIITETRILQLVDFNDYLIFGDSASIQTMVMLFRKDNKTVNYQIDLRKLLSGAKKSDMIDLLSKRQTDKTQFHNYTLIRDNYINTLLTFSDNEKVLDKIRKDKLFFRANEVAQGIVFPQDFLNKKNQSKLGMYNVGDGVFGLSDDEKNQLNLSIQESKLIKPYFTTDQIQRYYTDKRNRLWLIYTDSSYKNPSSLNEFPNIKQHLDKFVSIMTSDNKPYGLHRAREERFFMGEKIISQRKCVGKPVFSYSSFDCYVTQTFYIIQTSRWNMKFLTGLLNSKLVTFWLRYKGKMQGENFQVDKEPLLNIPLPRTDVNQQAVITLVNQILNAKQENPQVDTSEWEDEIDQLVYQLYKLTDEEIAAVEGIFL